MAVAYESRSITIFKSQFKRGFTKVVITTAGCLREWSQGELFSTVYEIHILRGGLAKRLPLLKTTPLVDVTDFNCQCILKENSHIHMLDIFA